MFSQSFLPVLKGWSWLWWSGSLCCEPCSATWRRLKIFVLDHIAQKPTLTVDCKRIATAISHFHLSFSEVNGGWPIMLKLAENSFWFNHQFFSSYFKFLIQACTVSLLFKNCHWSLKVPLSCNLMGYLLAIKINGHELNLPRNGFWPKYHSVKFSVTFTGVNRQRRLWNDRGHCSFLLRMGKNRVWVSSGEGLWEERCIFLSTLALSIS